VDDRRQEPELFGTLGQGGALFGRQAFVGLSRDWIGSSASFVGNVGANTQFVTRIGLRHTF